MPTLAGPGAGPIRQPPAPSGTPSVPAAPEAQASATRSPLQERDPGPHPALSGLPAPPGRGRNRKAEPHLAPLEPSGENPPAPDLQAHPRVLVAAFYRFSSLRLLPELRRLAGLGA